MASDPTTEENLRRWALACPLAVSAADYVDVTVEIRGGRVIRYHIHRTTTIAKPGHDPGRQSERPRAASQ